MGNHVSSDVWVKLRERTVTLTMLDLMKAARREPGAGMEQQDTISEEATLQTLMAALADKPAGALLVTDAQGNVTSSIDMFRVARYILHLYEGATTVRRTDVVHETYDFWFGWDQWIERRAVDMPTSQAADIIRRAAMSFYLVSIKEVLAVRSLERFSRTMHPIVAVRATAPLRDALHYWAEGYTNLVVRTQDDRLHILSQTDVLAALFTGLVDNNLRGAGGIAFTKLGISRKVLYSVRPENRALQAFRLMSDRAVQAVPITDARGDIKGEISLASLRALRSDTFHALMSTVAEYQEMMAHVDPPLTVGKKATVGDVIRAMHLDPLKRTHVWVTSSKQYARVTGVVSLTDIVQAIIMKLNSE